MESEKKTKWKRKDYDLDEVETMFLVGRVKVIEEDAPHPSALPYGMKGGGVVWCSEDSKREILLFLALSLAMLLPLPLQPTPERNKEILVTPLLEGGVVGGIAFVTSALQCAVEMAGVL